jgi:hypothetical protein
MEKTDFQPGRGCTTGAHGKLGFCRATTFAKV